MPRSKGRDSLSRGRLANPIRHVNGVKVGIGDEAVHRAEADMVGIHVVGPRPPQRLDGCIRRRARACGLGPDDHVLAVGFVPDRDDLNALLRGRQARAQLGGSLPREAVADS